MEDMWGGSMPRPEVQLACESRSMRRTRCPRSASAWARFMAVVVFPTPPFWLAMAMTFTCDEDGGKGVVLARQSFVGFFGWGDDLCLQLVLRCGARG